MIQTIIKQRPMKFHMEQWIKDNYATLKTGARFVSQDVGAHYRESMRKASIRKGELVAENRAMILAYIQEHPEATNEHICERFGVGHVKVRLLFKHAMYKDWIANGKRLNQYEAANRYRFSVTIVERWINQFETGIYNG